MKIYFDWSDLDKFHKILRGEQVEGFPAGFEETIQNLLHNHEIILSFNHLMDLGRGSIAEKILARAEWLDGLTSKNWMLPVAEIEFGEIETLIQNKVLFDQRKFNPFCTFQEVFVNYRNGVRVTIHDDATIKQFVEEISLSVEGRKILGVVPSSSIKGAEYLHKDGREYVDRGMPASDLVIRDMNFVRAIEEKIQTLISKYSDRLQGKDIHTIVTDLSKDSILQWPHLPMTLIQRIYIQELHNELKMKLALGKSFIQKQGSNFDDMGHLAGAAYCDLFSCDRLTYLRIKSAEDKVPAKIISRGANNKEFFQTLTTL